MQYRPVLFAALLFAFGVNLLYAQSGKSDPVQISARQFLPEIEKRGAVPLDADRPEFRLDLALTKGILPSAEHLLITDFPVAPSVNMNVDLHRTRSVVDANTRFLVAGKEGDVASVPPQVLSYTGSIRGEEGSKIFISFTNRYVVANIRRADGTIYMLGPALDQISGEKVNEKQDESRHVLMDANGIKRELGESFDCATLGDPEIPETGIPSVQVTDSTTLLEVEVAVETDTEFFKATGKDVAKAQAYTIALFSMVSTIYEEEVHVTIYIPWMKTWTENDPDPYDVAGDAYALPDKVAPYWRDHYADVHRDVAHVMTSIGYGGGGFGYYNALCGGSGDQSFSVSSVQGYHSYPTFSFTYDVYIVAHELGHNFNVPHSHNCFWGAPIDTCIVDEGISGGCLPASQTPKPNPGSIMSYCGGINNTELGEYKVRMTFLPQVAAVMRATAESASCLTEPEDPKVILVQPHGPDQLIWNRQPNRTITWRSAHADFVDLAWSSDGGANWNPIAQNLPAGDERYDWKLPEICARSVIVRIVESSNYAVADTSLFPFPLLQKEPTGLVAYYPLNDDTQDKAACGFYPASGGGTFDSDRDGTAKSAYRFNGAEQLATPNFLERFDGGITLAFWFKLDGTNGVQTFIAQDWAQGGGFAAFSWNGQFGGAFWTTTDAVPLQVWGSPLEGGKWYHAAVTYDGKISRAYIDGAEAGNIEKTATVKYSEAPVTLGSRNGAEALAGEIDEIRVYDRALTPEEIQALYTVQNQPLAAPILTTPPDASANLPTGVTLQWNSVPAAIGYHVQLGTAASFVPPSLLIDDSTTTGTVRAIVGLAGQREYFWRVRGLNGSGVGAWSTPFGFTTGAFSSVAFSANGTAYVALEARMSLDGTSLHLRYKLPSLSNIRIAIYDRLGREMMISESREEEGTRERIIATENLPAGVYFCRLIGEESGKGIEKIAPFVIVR